ncbi:hypothetical protein ABVK25_004326 [Lepraria finkii]|uniref:Uncharacterized protein n=1 Tax=Lepraria finkii TaxID=1340010 RepID=A0ABR4BDK0_9LECA
MPVPFGISIGDFISGYEELDRELKNLNKGLECIQGLSLDKDRPAQALVINEALNDCRQFMETFLQRIGKLLESRYKGCNSVAFASFQREFAQTARATRNQLSIQSELRKSTAQQIDEHKDISTIIKDKVSEQSRNHEHLGTVLEPEYYDPEPTAHVEKAAIDQQYTKTRATLAGDTLHSTLNSSAVAEALTAVLNVRFKDVGYRKIENEDLVLFDSLGELQLRLEDPWDTVVRSGQHITVSMKFCRQATSAIGRCPKCGTYNGESDNAEVKCENPIRGMIYRGVRAKLNNAGETDADDPNSELAANNETRRDLSLV